MSTSVDGAKSWNIFQQNLEDLQIPRGRGGGGNFAHDGGATEDVATQISWGEQ